MDTSSNTVVRSIPVSQGADGSGAGGALETGAGDGGGLGPSRMKSLIVGYSNRVGGVTSLDYFDSLFPRILRKKKLLVSGASAVDILFLLGLLGLTSLGLRLM